MARRPAGRLVRGQARVVRPGVVEVKGQELEYETLVVATGSSPATPPVPGLEEVESWTTRDATSSHHVPASLIVLGGGVAGCELGQLYRRLGSEVTIVQRNERLLPRDDRRPGRRSGRPSRRRNPCPPEGGRRERRAPTARPHVRPPEERREPDRRTAPGLDGTHAECRRARARAAGRRGLAARDPGRRTAAGSGRRLRDRGRHRQAALHPRGQVPRPRRRREHRRPGSRRRLPRGAGGRVHRPQIATVGRTEGDGLVFARWEIEKTSRSSTYERAEAARLSQARRRPAAQGARRRGRRRARGRRVGCQQLTLAIRAEVPIATLLDVIQPFPTFSRSSSGHSRSSSCEDRAASSSAPTAPRPQPARSNGHRTWRAATRRS